MRVFVTVLALAPCASFAFLDDFDGDDISPQWAISAPNTVWHYALGNSLLSVDQVYGQPGPGGHASLQAFVGAQSNFDLTARLGWGSTTGESMTIALLSGSSGYASMTYLRPTGPFSSATIIASLAEYESTWQPAPTSGLHDFRIRRIGANVSMWFDGTILYGFGESVVSPDTIYLSFGGIGTTDLLADRIELVPESHTAVTMGAALIMVLWLRRSVTSRAR